MTEKVVWGEGGVSVRTTAPSTKSSTREIPFVSAELDCVATVSPATNVLPLGGEAMMTAGLVTRLPTTLHPGSMINNAKNRTRDLRLNISLLFVGEMLNSIHLIQNDWLIGMA